MGSFPYPIHSSSFSHLTLHIVYGMIRLLYERGINRGTVPTCHNSRMMWEPSHIHTCLPRYKFLKIPLLNFMATIDPKPESSYRGITMTWKGDVLRMVDLFSARFILRSIR